MYSQVVLLGVLVSLLYTELTGYSAGLVVPGYLALSLHTPLRLGYTLVVALAAVALCRVLSRVVIVYGRRRFALLLILTLLLGWMPILPGGAGMVGYLVPGIAAREMDRQGILETLLSLAVTTGFVALLMLLLGYPVW